MRCQNSDLVVAKLCMCPMRGQTNTLTSCALLNALGSIQGSGTTSLSPTATSTGTVIAAASSATEIGRASCRGRVCQYVSILVVAGNLKKKKEIQTIQTY